MTNEEITDLHQRLLQAKLEEQEKASEADAAWLQAEEENLKTIIVGITF